MKKGILTLVTAFLLMAQGLACDPLGLTGIMEENDLWIPAGLKTTSGITKERFDRVLDRIESIYAPIIKAKGKTLRVDRDWEDGTVNAYASREGYTWVIKMFGGLARHHTVTEDGFALVACHEIGHHLGGAPKRTSIWGVSAWASNEGQSDYFASAKCMHKYYEVADKEDEQDTVDLMAQTEVPSYVTQKCSTQFQGAKDIAFCERSSLAGMSLSSLFHDMRRSPTALSFETPDPNIVTKTSHRHPPAQCRLDTYFQGALCNKDPYLDPSQSDPDKNVCSRAHLYEVGVRPLCWYKPTVATPAPEPTPEDPDKDKDKKKERCPWWPFCW